MDKLIIIRHMLSVIGESGLSDASSLHPSVITANGVLDTTDFDLQSKGWWFNTERQLTLVQDSDGKVTLPGNTLSFSLSNVHNLAPAEKVRYSKRGNRLYDTFKHSDVIGHPITVDITVRLSVEDLPSVAFNYVMHDAAYNMYVNDDGDNFKTDKLFNRRVEAWQRLYAEHLKVTAANALDNPTAQRLRMAGAGSHRSPNTVGSYR